MRISDWSSDVCSSDLQCAPERNTDHAQPQRQQEYALDKGDPRTRHSGPAKGDEPCQRDRSVTDEIERVGLERLAVGDKPADDLACRSEEHTSELQSLMRISYAVFCLKKKLNSGSAVLDRKSTSPE